MWETCTELKGFECEEKFINGDYEGFTCCHYCGLPTDSVKNYGIYQYCPDCYRALMLEQRTEKESFSRALREIENY